MPITESTTIDSVTVKESGHVEVKRADRIFRNEDEIAKTFHRHVLAPGDDLSAEDPKVVAIATAAWTPEVLAAHEARVAEMEERTKAAGQAAEPIPVTSDA
jgi:hypothetical protein